MDLHPSEHRAARVMAVQAMDSGHGGLEVWLLAQCGRVLPGLDEELEALVADHPEYEYLQSYVDKRLCPPSTSGPIPDWPNL